MGQHLVSRCLRLVSPHMLLRYASLFVCSYLSGLLHSFSTQAGFPHLFFIHMPSLNSASILSMTLEAIMIYDSLPSVPDEAERDFSNSHYKRWGGNGPASPFSRGGIVASRRGSVSQERQKEY